MLVDMNFGTKLRVNHFTKTIVLVPDYCMITCFCCCIGRWAVF